MSEINENRPTMKTNRAKIVVTIITVIGVVLMTTLAILPNTTENVQANPCSHNTATYIHFKLHPDIKNAHLGSIEHHIK